MPAEKIPKSSTWIRVHIVYPLIPFFLDGLIRYISADYVFNLTTFSSATLAMSIALLCVFVNQSILTKKPIIPNELDNEDLLGAASQFMTYAFFGIAGFCILVLLKALNEFHGMKTQPICESFTYAIFVLSLLPILNAIRAQRSFKLRTTT